MQTKDIQLVDLWGLNMDEELSREEESFVRSVIGSLQWASATVRPDRAFCLGKVLGDLNREHKKRSLPDANDLIARYNAYGNLDLRIMPLKGRIDIDVYGVSALSGANLPNHQGIVLVFRETESENVNFISWKSSAADRKAWSSLALDKLVHIHAVFKELQIGVNRSCALTDNLSLRRCVY